MNKRRIISIAIALAFAIGIWWFKNHSNSRDVASDSAVVTQGANGKAIAEVNPGNPDVHIAMGLPTDNTPADDYILKRAQYILSYNNNKHNPNWVSWNLSDYWYGDAERHKGQFMPDPDLPKELYRVVHRDYTNSGFDRGHMCRSEERTRNDEDNTTTFYTTNLLPQYHELNAGPWLRLEDMCQTLCKRYKKELYVIAGPIYSKDMGTIGNGVAVPSECFKIIVVLEKGQSVKDVTENTRIIAVRMPNSRDIEQSQWRNYETTVRDIEKATGYNFLSNLPQALQDKIENNKDKGEEPS